MYRINLTRIVCFGFGSGSADLANVSEVAESGMFAIIALNLHLLKLL